MAPAAPRASRRQVRRRRVRAWGRGAHVGAPLARAREALGASGVLAVPVGNTPSLEVLDRRAVRPVAAGFALLEEIARHHAEFAWGKYPTAANPSGEGHLERIGGVR